jgi:hypothetical protein
VRKLLGALPAAAIVRDVIGLAGAALLAYGTWCIYRPAGYIVAGALLIAGSILAARGD